jgi:hypothetical protein
LPAAPHLNTPIGVLGLVILVDLVVLVYQYYDTNTTKFLSLHLLLSADFVCVWQCTCSWAAGDDISAPSVADRRYLANGGPYISLYISAPLRSRVAIYRERSRHGAEQLSALQQSCCQHFNRAAVSIATELLSALQQSSCQHCNRAPVSIATEQLSALQQSSCQHCPEPTWIEASCQHYKIKKEPTSCSLTFPAPPKVRNFRSSLYA